MTSQGRHFAFRGAKYIIGKRTTVKVSSTYVVFADDKKKHTVNCGRIISESSSNNKEAFVVGVENAASEFSGEIIAIIKNKKTQSDYWVVAPGGRVFYEPMLRQMLGKFCDEEHCSFICLYEKSCGAVLYTEEDGIRRFLLIKNMSGHVGFPKGHVEHGESEIETAKREVWEETGIHPEIEPGFREYYNYSVNSFVKKQAVYYLSSFYKKDVVMDIREISEYTLVTFEEGMKILNYPHDRSILSKAEKFISSKR